MNTRLNDRILDCAPRLELIGGAPFNAFLEIILRDEGEDRNTLIEFVEYPSGLNYIYFKNLTSCLE